MDAVQIHFRPANHRLTVFVFLAVVVWTEELWVGVGSCQTSASRGKFHDSVVPTTPKQQPKLFQLVGTARIQKVIFANLNLTICCNSESIRVDCLNHFGSPPTHTLHTTHFHKPPHNKSIHE